MKGPLFYSKILLFGEYGIIRDSKGLSIPYNFYNGALKKEENPSAEAIASNASLKRFADYLEKNLILMKQKLRNLWKQLTEQLVKKSDKIKTK